MGFQKIISFKWHVLPVLILTLTNCTSKKDESGSSLNTPKALLATRFESLDDFKRSIDIKYEKTLSSKSKVTLTYHNSGSTIVSELCSGVSQTDILDAKNGTVLDKAQFMLKSPFAVRSRNDLGKIYLLARRQANIFGYGDAAFYDLAQTSEKNINTIDLGYLNSRDSSEKGYINTFNHITAQAIITTLFSEELADFIADVHELHNMPELTTGDFSLEQMKDTVQYPLDNYVDMINNELGQEIGNTLKAKYSITSSTEWTAELLSNYLNDIQRYYMWSFGIGLKPYKANNIKVKKFAQKINKVMKDT